jgi:Putative collagen-binding domain of a collagenase
LASKDIVADLILFADAGRIFGTPIQDARYTRYAIARFAAYHNVIWCMTNGWNFTGRPRSYWNREGSIVRDEDPWMSSGTTLRPLSIHQNSGLTFNYPPPTHTWPTYVIIQLRGSDTPHRGGAASYLDIPDAWGNQGITANSNLSMPVVNDEYGYIGSSVQTNRGTLKLTRTNQRRIIWGIATAGGYGSAGDATPLAKNDFPWLTSDWEDEPEYGDIRRMVDFFTIQGIQYWMMASSNRLTSNTRVYALGQARREYVAYSALGGRFTLNLPPPRAGRYQVTWYNPATGAYTSAASIGGGRRTFTLTFRGDAVLHLRSQ